MPVERQAEMVRKVSVPKAMVEHPSPSRSRATLAEARQKMAETQIGGLVVIGEASKLMGLLTARDLLLARMEAQVRSVMTREKLVVAPADEALDSARLKLHAHRIEKLPWWTKKTRGWPDHRSGHRQTAEHPRATKDARVACGSGSGRCALGRR
jgi:IMP dehydrogenase